MSAETGVGPSIASGNQTWSGNWALLPIAPANTSSAIPVTIQGASSPVAALSTIRSTAGPMSSVPTVVQMAKIPMAKPTSPIRLTMNAFFAASAAERRRYQKPMSR